LIAFRGSGEPHVNDGFSNGWEGPMLGQFLITARGLRFADGGDLTGVPVYGVPYQAVSSTNPVTFTLDLGASVDDGVRQGLAAVRGVAAACPGRTRVVLAGYSQGAMVVHRVALQSPAGVVGGSFLIGDPDQKPGAPGVYGPGSAGDGLGRILLGGTDAFYTLPIVRFSYCHSGDPICDFTYADALSTGPHSSYGQSADERLLLAEYLANVARAAAGLPIALGS
jgi:hypothetical protein